MSFVTHLLAASFGAAVGIFAIAICYVGRSVETCRNTSLVSGWYVCSECGFQECYYHKENSYCPNCGRKVVGR